MGVDISFHIEVHRKGKWHAFVWQTPNVFESEPTDDGEWATHHACCTFRYHNIEGFECDQGVYGLPDDVAAETVGSMRENSRKGWFYFCDFAEYLSEKKAGLFDTLSKCKEMEFMNRLDRIERLARGEKVPISRNPGFAGFEIKKIVEDYEDSTDALIRLFWIVEILTKGISDKDIRLVYEIW